ncbi:MAG: methyltransferase [Chloroflexota bacterium]
MRLEAALLQFPFLLTLLAGGMAGASAVLLRRASAAFGGWLRVLSTLLDAAAAAAFVLSFAWAWAISDASCAAGFPLFLVLGLAAVLGGVALAIQALAIRGMGALHTWPQARLEKRTPYRQLRRPIAAGVMLIALGVALLVDTIVLWVCFVVWLLIVHLLLELREWDMRQRFPEAGDYLRRTPRHFPRLRRPPSSR